MEPEPGRVNWGYGGSGPAQLALAVCLKFMPQEQAVARHQGFKREVIAALAQEDFEIELTLIQIRGQDAHIKLLEEALQGFIDYHEGDYERSPEIKKALKAMGQK